MSDTTIYDDPGISVTRGGGVLDIGFAFDVVSATWTPATTIPNLASASARIEVFDVPQVMNLILPESYSASNHIIMNNPISSRSDFRLVRGISNTLQFFVRDIDRHVAIGPLANATLTLTITDTHCNALLLSRPMYPVNPAIALYGVTILPSDIADWATGALRYSVIVVRGNGATEMLWTDRAYAPYGQCEMMDGPVPGPALPQTLTPATFVINNGLAYSSALPGSASKGYPNGLQTFSFYTLHYTGTIAIQGNLSDQPSTVTQDWFDVEYVPFVNATGVTAANVVGNFLWLRVAIPTATMQITNPAVVIPPLGGVTQILYLN